MNKRKYDSADENRSTIAHAAKKPCVALEIDVPGPPDSGVGLYGDCSAGASAQVARLNETGPANERQSELDLQGEVAVPISSAKKTSISQNGTQPSTRRRSRKIGRLELFNLMPTDIFYEIASNLSPLDLLNLARSTKSFREILTSKRSKSVWRAARDAMGMPDCPDDLTEMQYADLMFGKGCSICNAPRTKAGLYFYFRLRLCGKCWTDRVILCRKLSQTIKEAEPPLLRSLIRKESVPETAVLIEEYRYVFDSLKSLPADSDEHKKFVAARQNFVNANRMGGNNMWRWMEPMRWKKKEEKWDNIHQWRSDVLDRLKQNGYTSADLSTRYGSKESNLKWERLLRDPRRLTDRIWRSIEPKLAEIIAERRKERSV